MTFWIIVSIICILISILFYFSITQGTPNQLPDSDLEVYKDQLINVERDLSRGIITEDEAERIPVSYTHSPSPRDLSTSRMPSSA